MKNYTFILFTQKIILLTLNLPKINQGINKGGNGLFEKIFIPVFTLVFLFKVREFSVTDIQPFPIKLVWSGANKEDCGEMEVFPRNHAVPFSKMLTFYKSEAFCVTGEYSAPVPYPTNHIGVFEISKLIILNIRISSSHIWLELMN